MKKLMLIALLSLILLVLGGCGKKEGTVVLEIYDEGIELQTLLPDIDMTIASYKVMGAGSLGKSFTLDDQTATNCTIQSLAFGEWTITVYALNAAGIIIGEGSAEASVHVGLTTPVTVVVKPLIGAGTLNVTVNWNPDDTEAPAISSQLHSPLITDELIFSQGMGTASYLDDSITTGYYSLIVKLMDSGILTMGAVEVVRIVKGGITSGEFNFLNINQPGGDIIVGITPEMDDPIEVSMSGQVAELGIGESMTVVASVPAEVGNVVYVWYINGESKSVDPTYTISNLEPGVYRLDVTAFTTDGMRAGSATYTFTVTETPTSTPTSEYWIKTYGDYDNDRYGVISKVWDGGYVVAGGSNSFNADSNSLCPLIFKVDSEGQLVWSREYESSRSGEFFSNAQAMDGGFFGVGYLGDYLSEDALLIKVNSLGQTEYAITCGSVYPDVFTSVSPTTDDGCYAVGYTDTDGSGEHKILFVKFDINGMVDSGISKLIHTEWQSKCHNVLTTSDNGAVLVGEATDGYMTMGFVIKMSVTGNIEWYQLVGREGVEYTTFRAVEENVAGFILVGYTDGIGSYNKEDVFVMQVSHSGSMIWSKAYGGYYNEQAFSIERDPYDYYVIAGDCLYNPQRDRDVYLLKIDGSGNIAAQVGIGGAGQDMCNDVVISDNGEVAGVGETWSFGAGFMDYLVFKADYGCGVPDSPNCYPINWLEQEVLFTTGYCSIIESPLAITYNSVFFTETTPVIPSQDVTFQVE